MKKYLVSASLALAALSLSVAVSAAPGGKQEQVMFAAGKSAKTVKGSVQGKGYCGRCGRRRPDRRTGSATAL